MKKNNKIIIFIIIINFILCSFVNAQEVYDITNDSVIKYKWYKNDIADSKYYKKGEKLEGYLENIDRVKYGEFTDWDSKYCNYPSNLYSIESDYNRIYRKVIDVNFIKIFNFKDNDFAIRVLENHKEIPFTVIKKTSDEIILDLNGPYSVDSIIIFVDTENSFDIEFAFDRNFYRKGLSKHINREKLLIPDNSWINDNTSYVNLSANFLYFNNDFLELKNSTRICRVKEILTYRYKTSKHYYDNMYHEFVMGYIPDRNNYILEYKGKLPVVEKEKIKTVTNTVREEVPVIKNVPVKEFVYIEKESVPNNPIEEDKIRYIENDVIKQVKYIPRYFYYIIIGLFIIVFLETVLLIKKSRLK